MNQTTKGFLMKTIDVDGKTYRYIVYIPPTYDPDKPMPTIISLNGAGECGTDGLKQLSVGLGATLVRKMEEWPFIILFPQKQTVDSCWEDDEHVEMIMAILDKAKKELNIDGSRLYLTGISQGGHGTWAVASKYPELFAAIVPVCGWGDEEMGKGLAKLPIRTFHGDADDIIPLESSIKMKNCVETAGGSCDLKIYPGINHNSWDKAYQEENLSEWFLSHKKK